MRDIHTWVTIQQMIILKANKVKLFVSSIFVCFLVPFTECFRHTTYVYATFIGLGLKQKNIEVSQMVDNPADHCQEVEF
jgi:hypothetical protein